MQPETEKQRRARLMGETSHMALMSALAVHRLDAAWAALSVSPDGVIEVPAGHDTVEYEVSGGKAKNVRTRRADR